VKNDALIIDDLHHKYDKRECANWILNKINLKIKNGELLGLLGPSGCGKTTLLRLIAGFEYPSKGRISLNDEEISSRKKILSPEKRNIGMVFQDYALFPHLTVLENVIFGLKNKKDRSRVDYLLNVVGLDSFVGRYPHELSGGQKQRVAIGRAIIRKPKAFLFDEPLSNLDAALRVEMRLEISKLHKELGVTTIYVTHDQVEAMTLADKIVVLNEGKIIQIGSPHKLYNYPKNLFVAEFIGTPKMNILDCIKKEGYIYLDENKKTNIKTKKESMFKLGIRTDNIEICKSEKNILSGHIKFCEYLGSEQYVYVDCGINDKLIIVKLDPNFKVVLNEKIGLKFISKYVHFFSKDGLRLI